MAVIQPLPKGTLTTQTISRLTEAIKHLRHNTEFEIILEDMKHTHAKEWGNFCRNPNIASAEYARGRMSMLAELYKLFAGKEVIDA